MERSRATFQDAQIDERIAHIRNQIYHRVKHGRGTESETRSILANRGKAGKNGDLQSTRRTNHIRYPVESYGIGVCIGDGNIAVKGCLAGYIQRLKGRVSVGSTRRN